MTPTFAGFIEFLRDTVGISTDVLPDDATIIPLTYERSVELVNTDIMALPTVYTLCVYNLGTSFLLNTAPDAPDAPEYRNGLPFFAYIRKSWNTYGFVPGVITSASDVSTSESMMNPNWMKNLTLADLQLLKDPYGRAYLADAQKYGELWGLS